MIKMNQKTLVWVAILGGAGYGIWWMVKNMHVTPREKNILTIFGGNFDGFQDEFLKAWAGAKKANSPEFTFNGKVYLTDGGRAKK